MAWTETSVLMTVLSFGQVVVMDGEERIGEERQKLVENLGRRIRELRTQQGISQEGLAALAGIDHGYMGHIERGSRNISVVKIFAIAGAPVGAAGRPV